MTITTNNRITMALARAKRDATTTHLDLIRLYGLSQAEALRVLEDAGRL